MKHYRIYGLNLTVNIAVLGLIAVNALASDFPTVNVVLGELPHWLRDRHPAGFPNWYTRGTESEVAGADVPLFQVWQIEPPTDYYQRPTDSHHRQSDVPPPDEYFYCLYQDGTTFVVSRFGTQIWAT